MKSIPVALATVATISCLCAAGIGAASSSTGGGSASQAAQTHLVRPTGSSPEDATGLLAEVGQLAFEPPRWILGVARYIPGWISYFLLVILLPMMDEVAKTLQDTKTLPLELRGMAAVYDTFYAFLRNLGYVP